MSIVWNILILHSISSSNTFRFIIICYCCSYIFISGSNVDLTHNSFSTSMLISVFLQVICWFVYSMDSELFSWLVTNLCQNLLDIRNGASLEYCLMDLMTYLLMYSFSRLWLVCHCFECITYEITKCKEFVLRR